MITCPSCQTPAPPGAVFCDHCGYDLRTVTPSTPIPPVAKREESNSLRCPLCQHENIPGSAFCENCGAQLSGPLPSAPKAMPQSPPAGSPSPGGLWGGPPVQAPGIIPAAGERYEPPAAPSPWNTPVGSIPAPAAPLLEMSSQPPVDQTPYGFPAQPSSAAPSPAPSVTGRLVIVETMVSLPIPPGKQVVVMGREDPVSGVFPDIDLDPYGGHDAGVGRRHAQIILQGGQVYLEDLDSVNGTALNRCKLAPHQPQPLQAGDEIRLGKMALTYYS